MTALEFPGIRVRGVTANGSVVILMLWPSQEGSIRIAKKAPLKHTADRELTASDIRPIDLWVSDFQERKPKLCVLRKRLARDLPTERQPDHSDYKL